MTSGVVIIPARLESTRLPRKLLLDQTGHPLLWHTVQRAREAQREVIVATDSQQIADVVYDWHLPDVRAHVTGECPNGTSRVIQTYCELELLDQIVVNMQADEPEFPGILLEPLFCMLTSQAGPAVATLAAPIHSRYNLMSSDVVKVVVNHHRQAMYFSRSPIPHDGEKQALRHIGIYAMNRAFIQHFGSLSPATYQCEQLEQLQWLEAGIPILVETCNLGRDETGIDRAEQYAAFVARHLSNTKAAATR